MLILGSLALAVALGQDDQRRADYVEIGGNSYVRIVGRANHFFTSRQDGAVLRPSADGGFTLAWQSRAQNSGTAGVYARRFDRLGRGISPETLACPAGQPSIEPALTATADTAIVMSLWADDRETALFVAGKPLAPGKESQRGAVTATDPDHGTLAAWLETRNGKEQVYAKNLNASNAFSLSSKSVPAGTAAIAPLGSGVVVVWQQSDGRGLWARSVDWNGQPTCDAKKIVGGNALEPSVDATRDRVVVGYCVMDGNGRSVVRTVVLDGQLRRLGEVVPVQGQTGSQNGVAVGIREDGAVAVAWNRHKGEECDVFVQLFASDGKPQGPAFMAHPESKGDQRTVEASGSTRLAYDAFGLTLAWSGDSGLGDSTAANFTRIVPVSALTTDDKATLAALKPMDAEVQAFSEQPQLKVDKIIFEQAGPHEPPLFASPKIWNQKVFEPSLTGGFNGFSQTSFTPPDMDIAVGPDHLVVTVNDGIAFFTKEGAQTYVANMRLTNGFWGNLAQGSDFIYDPECFYDTISNRFFVMATQGNGTPTAGLVAISDDSDPNGNWYKYRFSTQAFASSLFDSPNIGCDANVFYMTGDAFSQNTYPVFCIEKAALLVGANPVIKSVTMPTTTQSAGIPDVQDGDAQAYYLVEHKEGGSNTSLRIVALRDPLGVPNFTNFDLTVPAYDAPEAPPQQGTTSRVNTFDTRIWSLQYRNGSLWASHHIGSSRVLARWYEIKLNGWPTSGNNPSLVQSGDIVIGTTGRTFFPAVHADLQGNAAMYYARSSPTEFMSAAHSSRRYGDALGTMSASVIDKAANAGYTSGRWGDYTGLEADPAYPSCFWGFGEWAEGQSWRAWVQPFRATDEVWATGFSLFRGVLEGGDAKSLLKGDGSVMTVRNGIVANLSEPPAAVVLNTRSCMSAPNSLSFTWTNRVTTGGLNQRVELFDWVANAYEMIDSRSATLADQTVTIAATNPARFVQAGTNAMRARISAKAPGPVGAVVWRMITDKALWIVN